MDSTVRQQGDSRVQFVEREYSRTSWDACKTTTGALLGRVLWQRVAATYVFRTADGVYLSQKALYEILSFCRNMTVARRRVEETEREQARVEKGVGV